MGKWESGMSQLGKLLGKWDERDESVLLGKWDESVLLGKWDESVLWRKWDESVMLGKWDESQCWESGMSQ